MDAIRSALLMTLLAAPAVHALSVDQYSRLEQTQSRAAESYMAGVADAISALRSARGSALSCAPAGTEFTSEEVARHYRDYLRTYPQVRKQVTDDVTVADLVLGAYAAEYCGRAGAPRTEERTPYPLSPLPPAE